MALAPHASFYLFLFVHFMAYILRADRRSMTGRCVMWYLQANRSCTSFHSIIMNMKKKKKKASICIDDGDVDGGQAVAIFCTWSGLFFFSYLLPADLEGRIDSRFASPSFLSILYFSFVPSVSASSRSSSLVHWLTGRRRVHLMGVGRSYITIAWLHHIVTNHDSIERTVMA